MEPVTAAAFIAGISAAASTGLSEVTKKAILDAYEGLKSLLKKKFGHTSDVAQSLDRLEQKPERRDLQQTLGVELAEVEADRDPDLLAAARALLEILKTHPGGERHVQYAVGSYIAQADRGSTATVTRPGLPAKADK